MTRTPCTLALWQARLGRAGSRTRSCGDLKSLVREPGRPKRTRTDRACRERADLVQRVNRESSPINEARKGKRRREAGVFGNGRGTRQPAEGERTMSPTFTSRLDRHISP